jgi:MFS family permease
MTAAIIGVAFQRVAGYLIDRFGERRVMIGDGIALSVVCIGYGYAFDWFGTASAALPVASACYVADNLLFALGNARVAYLSRLTQTPEEITSTLSMGVSINHIASMTIPAVAGTIWVYFGYERLFAVAALLALVNAALALRVPRRGALSAAPATVREDAAVPVAATE